MSAANVQREIRAAERYEAPDDLWVVSTYFDSEGFASKSRALRAYLRSITKSGIHWLLVEGSFGKRPFVLPASEHVIHIHCPSVMWQKERLLNLAIHHLPKSCHKVAWLDTDIFFENPRWAIETSQLLNEVPIVQPFDTALWLPKGQTRFRGRGIVWSGFAATARRHPGLFLSGDFDRHGHSGYAWAARREIVEKHGLYDRSVVGSGDHLMAHAMMGDLSSPCVTNSVGAANPFRDSFHRWAKSFHRDVQSQVGFVPGAVLHRWHGDRKKRRYYKRMVGMLARGYDPDRDVFISQTGALEWTEQGSKLGRWMKDYFTGRREDGRPGRVEKIPWRVVEELCADHSNSLDTEMYPISTLLGPLATLVADQSSEWIDAGLTPVLPNLIASILIIAKGDKIRIDTSRAISHDGELHYHKVKSESEAHLRLLFRNHQSNERGYVSTLLTSQQIAIAPYEQAREMLDYFLIQSKRQRTKLRESWLAMSASERWARVSGVSEAVHWKLSEKLITRVRDPRWNDAPELKRATRNLVKRRVLLAGKLKAHPDPYDAVVGPGSSASGLEHV
ncbi:MAG: hypothetical protein KHF84_01250 [Thermoplasmata archaeon]|nr:hypothetical protein [Candidatus Sysuiplasma jiujiangense]MDG6997175.1 hypothetical protein [Nitrososphaerota archaeon]